MMNQTTEARIKDEYLECEDNEPFVDRLKLSKRVCSMAEEVGGENAMVFPTTSNLQGEQATKQPRRRFWMYLTGLFLFDVMALYSSFWLTSGMVAVPATGQPGWSGYLWPAVYALFILPFFPPHGLYSYHLIFFFKKHRRALQSAVAWGGITMLFVVGQCVLPHLAEFHSGVAFSAVFVCIVGMIWFVRTFGSSSHNLYRSFGISLIVVGAIYRLNPAQADFLAYNVWNMLAGLILAAMLLAAGRYFIIETVYNGWLHRSLRRQIAIVGTNEEADKIAAYIIENNAPFWIAGTIGCSGRLNATVSKRCLGDIVEIPALSSENRLSDIIVSDESLDRRTLISLMDFALSKGITVWFPPNVLPIIEKKTYIDSFCGMPMIRMWPRKRIIAYNRVKYALDAFLALPLMAVLLPVFGLIAAAIKLNSKGPVFYRADAIGKNGQNFKMFKFRSMKVNNDDHIHKQFVTKLIKGEIGKDDNNGKPLKITNDPRVTLVGKYLRKFSLDELPQLINVVLGQMSLIGPRPCLPYEFDVYQDWYKKRAAIRPGITGLWQVAGRSEVAFEDMILLDLYYLYNRSLWMDLNLLVETAFVVLMKKGAY